MADQLRHRRQHLPEREHLQATKNALVRWNEARLLTRRRVEELNAQVEKAETESHAIDAHLERLNKQLRTVIVAREAEALQHEIAHLSGPPYVDRMPPRPFGDNLETEQPWARRPTAEVLAELGVEAPSRIGEGT